MAAADQFVERYLLLSLRLGTLIPGLVDAYYGPAELSARVEAEARPDPAVLVAEARSLHDELDGSIEDPQRTRWLRAQLVGLETVARRLAGEAVAYVDEVERCYGVRPTLVPEDEFVRAHEALDAVLPGHGPVKERYQRWEELQVVPEETLMPALELLMKELRRRTQDLFRLPEGEDVELGFVQKEPWLAFNYYLGGLRSRVVFNTDLPWLSIDLLATVAHELYPGHHTERALKESLLVRERGWLEESALLVGTPQSLVAEAIAMVAPEMVAGEDVDELAARLLRPLGVPYQPEVAAAVRTHRLTLSYYAERGNVAYMLHECGATLDEAREYARRWSLATDDRVEKGIEFVADPTWRAYIYCYTEGIKLARRFVAGDPARFQRLLTEQLVPSDLA